MGLSLSSNFIILLITLLFSSSIVLPAKPCVPKQFPTGTICVCNGTYCDEFPPVGQLGNDNAAIYVSSSSGKRFERSTVQFQQNQNSSSDAITIQLNSTQQFQQIIGFGGAFTDSAGVNMNRLSGSARQNLLRAYFGEEGIGYTVARVIMASCDFSPRVYSYDDLSNDPLQCSLTSILGCLIDVVVGGNTDFELKKFNLTQEDFMNKISFFKFFNFN